MRYPQRSSTCFSIIDTFSHDIWIVSVIGFLVLPNPLFPVFPIFELISYSSKILFSASFTMYVCMYYSGVLYREVIPNAACSLLSSCSSWKCYLLHLKYISLGHVHFTNTSFLFPQLILLSSHTDIPDCFFPVRRSAFLS